MIGNFGGYSARGQCLCSCSFTRAYINALGPAPFGAPIASLTGQEQAAGRVVRCHFPCSTRPPRSQLPSVKSRGGRALALHLDPSGLPSGGGSATDAHIPLPLW